MKESKSLELLLNEIKGKKKEESELMLIAILAGAIKSEILLLNATIDYMLEHKESSEEEAIIDALVDKLVDKKELLKVLVEFATTAY